MYTLILIWSLATNSNGGTDHLKVQNLTYQECTQQIRNFEAGNDQLRLRYSQCINQGDVRQ